MWVSIHTSPEHYLAQKRSSKEEVGEAMFTRQVRQCLQGSLKESLQRTSIQILLLPSSEPAGHTTAVDFHAHRTLPEVFALYTACLKRMEEAQHVPT